MCGLEKTSRILGLQDGSCRPSYSALSWGAEGWWLWWCRHKGQSGVLVLVLCDPTILACFWGRPDGWRGGGGLRLALEGPFTQGPLHALCFLHAALLFVAPLAAPRALRGVCSCHRTWCHHVAGFVQARCGLCATTWWALCHPTMGLVPPHFGLCAITLRALCHHIVGFVPPCGGLRATTWWALCLHTLGFVPPLSGLGAFTPCATKRWALYHHSVGCVRPRGGLCGLVLRQRLSCCRSCAAAHCILPPPRYQSRGYGGAAPAARKVPSSWCSCCSSGVQQLQQLWGKAGWGGRGVTCSYGVSMSVCFIFPHNKSTM